MKTCSEVAAWAAGQEKQIVPSAQHTSCTVELVDLQKEVDVAVIDEIQVSPSAQ